MICGVLEVENSVQVNDKTRMSAVKSFAAKGEHDITKVEICPEGATPTDDDFIDITGADVRDWFLDWVYSGSTRDVTVTLRITTQPADPDASPDPINAVVASFTKTINVLTVADDALFSSDKDLSAIEPDILKWVPDGRASWLAVHRAAQEKILDALNKMGIVDKNGNALAKTAIIEVDEVRFWSRDLTLALIFKGIQNVKDDVFAEKAKFYFSEASKATNRAQLRLDVNGDGQLDRSEGVGFTSGNLVRR